MGFLRNILFLLLSLCIIDLSAYDLMLRDNIIKASPGDYIVLARGKNLTLWHIYDRTDHTLRIEEVSVPANRVDLRDHSWKEWIGQGANGNTSWIIYTVDLTSGTIQDMFSYTRNTWLRGAGDCMLTTLLNLPFSMIPEQQRKKIGLRKTYGTLWNPCMVIEGHIVDNVAFNAYRARWPNDKSDLSSRMVEIYVPQESDIYPSYLPYWLEAIGTAGKAKVRIIDAGKKMKSPKMPPREGQLSTLPS